MHDLRADITLTAGLTTERTIGEYETYLAVRREVMDHMLNPCEVSVACGRNTIFPTDIFEQRGLPPIAQIEGRVCHDIIRFERRVLVVKERIRIALTKVGFETTDSDIHMRHLPCRGVRFLPIDRDIAYLFLVGTDKLGGLYEHTSRTATRVVDTSVEGLQHLDYRAYDTRRCIELTGVLAFHGSELLQAVLIGATEQVTLLSCAVHLDIRE